jgi:threonyl-tRNA synthetase
MIHHAVLGSVERFIAVLLEHHRGKLPLWLTPDQVAILPVSPAQREYAARVGAAFSAGEFRAVLDDSNETLARRILAAHDQGIPMIAIVGAREVDAGSVTLRHRGGRQHEQSLADAVDCLHALQEKDAGG